MITMDDRDLKRFKRDLLEFKSRAYPFATKATINDAAKSARLAAKRNIRKRMTLRNKRTLQGVRVNFAKGLRVNRQESAVGSVDPWMEDQEFGSTRVSRGRQGRPVTTSQGSGEGDTARPRRKVARPMHSLRKIALSKRRRGGRRGGRRRALIAVKQAQKHGDKHIFLDLGGPKKATGIFKVTKRGIKLVQAMGQKSHVVPANPWLKPAVDEIVPHMPAIYRRALKQQLQRHGLFRG